MQYQSRDQPVLLQNTLPPERMYVRLLPFLPAWRALACLGSWWAKSVGAQTSGAPCVGDFAGSGLVAGPSRWVRRARKCLVWAVC